MHYHISSPSVLEEKFSKNEHDVAPVLLLGSNKDHERENKGLSNLTKDLASSDDVFVINGKAYTSGFPQQDEPCFPQQDEPSEEISVVTTKCSLPIPCCILSYYNIYFVCICGQIYTLFFLLKINVEK
jgi:hypothetical protein